MHASDAHSYFNLAHNALIAEKCHKTNKSGFIVPPTAFFPAPKQIKSARGVVCEPDSSWVRCGLARMHLWVLTKGGAGGSHQER